MDTNKILRERTNLRVVLTSLVVFLLGLFLLVWSANNEWWLWMHDANIQSVIQKVVESIGGLLMVSVAVSFFWELVTKRAFLDELLPKIHLSEDILSAGITGYKLSFEEDVEWDKLFRDVKELDILYHYGLSWFVNNKRRLNKAIDRSVQIRIVLVDPNDENALAVLARRFNQTIEQIKDKIIETKAYLETLQKSGAKISIWYLPAIPLYSIYRFDNQIVLSLYSHFPGREPGKGAVFLLEDEGHLSKFVLQEFEKMVRSGGLAKYVQ